MNEAEIKANVEKWMEQCIQKCAQETFPYADEDTWTDGTEEEE